MKVKINPLSIQHKIEIEIDDEVLGEVIHEISPNFLSIYSHMKKFHDKYDIEDETPEAEKLFEEVTEKCHMIVVQNVKKILKKLIE